ncbi:MAG: tetratricopeptide repeat protein [Lewinellaceae bacterium]|nr:tetratricopeptide repeat protein [Lewinellaceae bacterium]
MPTIEPKRYIWKPSKSESGWYLDNPQRYEPDVATTQNNLGIMYRNLNAYDRAEAVYLEALEIYQRLTLDNPQRYEPYVADTQNNLGNMYQNLNAYDRAEEVPIWKPSKSISGWYWTIPSAMSRMWR